MKRILLTKPIHLAFHLLLLSSLSMMIVACSSPSIQPNNALVVADNIIENYHSRHDDFALSQLQDALKAYTQYDQLEGVWQSEFLLANWYIARDQLKLATAHSEAAYHLAQKLKQAEKQFSSSIQLGQLTEKDKLFEEAETFASDDIKRAISLSHQEKFDEAHQLFNNQTGKASDLAFLYYRHAKAKDHLPSVLRARDYYIESENKTGVIDSLFLAAKLSTQDQSRDFAKRALKAAKAANDEFRAKAIENWSRSSL